MKKASKPAKPTYTQSSWLRRIAQAPMIKTYAEGHQATYSLTTGEAVPLKIAAALIGNGWVKGQRDGMFDDPQSYVVLKPDRLVVVPGSLKSIRSNSLDFLFGDDDEIPAPAGITEADASKREREESKR